MAKTGRKTVAETKGAKFSRLASKRVTVALAKIKLIGNLSGSGYEYTPEQVAKIATALKDAVVSTVAKFDKTAKKDATSEFTV